MRELEDRNLDIQVEGLVRAGCLLGKVRVDVGYYSA